MDALHQGSCLCGTVKYSVSTELKALTHCHCNMCQKGHGAAFASYASAPASTVSIVAGTQMLKGYESSKGVLRQFCCNCGSSLFWSDAKGAFSQWISIAIATLDSPCSPTKQKHACVGSKAGWYAIEDRHPQTD
ncbi:GFA family protein [Pseudomonas sp. NFX224]|uniref:GFA family protein n=1 Tax=Pseudomonas sp. NFX224 TaxID=3402862 RepID=UPI003AFB529E